MGVLPSWLRMGGIGDRRYTEASRYFGQVMERRKQQVQKGIASSRGLFDANKCVCVFEQICPAG